MLYADRKYAEAKRAYSEAIELSPQAALFTNRAACYVQECKWKKVVEDCDRALTLDPLWGRAFERKASALIKLQKHDEARSVAEAGVSLATSQKLVQLLGQAKQHIFIESQVSHLLSTHKGQMR